MIAVLIKQVFLWIIISMIKEAQTVLFLQQYVLSSLSTELPMCPTSQNSLIAIFTNDKSFTFDSQTSSLNELALDYSPYAIKPSSLAYNYGSNYYIICGRYLIALIDDTAQLLKQIKDLEDPLNTLYKESPMCSFAKTSIENQYIISFISNSKLHLVQISSDSLGSEDIKIIKEIVVDKSINYNYDFVDCLETAINPFEYFCLYAYTALPPSSMQNIKGVYYDASFNQLKSLLIDKKYTMIKRINERVKRKQEYILSLDLDLYRIMITDTTVTSMKIYKNTSPILNFEVTALSEEDPIVFIKTGLKSYFLIAHHKATKQTFYTPIDLKYDNANNYLSIQSLSNNFSNRFSFIIFDQNDSRYVLFDIQFPKCLPPSPVIELIPAQTFSMNTLGYVNQFVTPTKFLLIAGRPLPLVELGKQYDLDTLSISSTEVHYYKWIYVIRNKLDQADISSPAIEFTDSKYINSAFCEINISVCYYSCFNCMIHGNDLAHQCLGCKKYYLPKDSTYPTNCIYECPPGCSNCTEVEPYEYVCVSCKFEIKNTLTADNLLQLTEVECYTAEEIQQKIKTIEDIKQRLDQLYRYYPDIPLINVENCIVQIIDTTQDNQAPNNVSRINLGECENILREYYNIPTNEQLIIVKIDLVVETQITNKVSYTVHSLDGTNLDIGLCDEYPVEIKSPINNMSSELKETIEKYNELGIDLYNKSDPFFNDRCTPFDSSNSSDVPLKDRRSDLALNSSMLCSDNCNYNGINITDNTVSCECYSSVEASEPTKNEFDKLLGSFLGVLQDANFDVVTCSNLVFDRNIIKRNLGGWVVLSAISISFGNIFFFLFAQMPVLFSIFYRVVFDIAKSQIIQPKNNPTKSQQSNHLFFNSDSEVNHLQRRPEVTQIPIINPIESIKTYSMEELNEMNFDDAVKFDTRSYPKMYLGSILITQPLLDTFIYQNRKTLRSIKISIFCFGIILDFSLSAFFYSDKYISKTYKNGGNSSFLDNLPVSLYTYIFGMVFSILFNFLSSPSSLDKLTKIKDNDELMLKVSAFATFYKVKLILFFVFQFLFLCAFWYYVSAFCSVYQNSQTDWLISGFTSLGLNMALPFAYSIVLALIRFISIRYKYKWLFCVIWILMIVIECV